MALNLESCSIEDVCASMNGSEKLLIELRDRLYDWLKLQPHLPQDLPAEILEYFILGTKMSLEQAKKKLDMFYTMRTIVPEFLMGRDPRAANIVRMHDMMEIVYLPKLTPEKYRVCIFRAIKGDHSAYNASEAFKYSLMMDELLMTDSKAHSLGVIYVVDHLNTSLGMVSKYTPAVIKKFEVTITESHAQRVKAFYHVNVAPVTEVLLALIRKVISPKLASRIRVYPKGGYAALHGDLPKSILPKEYDGDEMSMAQLAEMWRKKVDNKRDWYLEQEKVIADESRRPGPTVDGESLFGFSGSFRKLDLD